PAVRPRLDALAASMTAMLEATRMALVSGLPPEAGGLIGQAAAVWLKPMVAPAGALIHGEGEGEADAERSPPSAPQAVVDGLMRPGA
ncbi:MAG: hypothetical protein P8Y53_14435, partial [Pseudolabrys sp.]